MHAAAAFDVITKTERLLVVTTPGKGRGVVANQAFAVGDTVELVPVLVIDDGDVLDLTPLGNYVFNWPTSESAVAVAFGCGSLYNHSYTPNARYTKITDGHGSIHFTAIKPIAVGEEICINYNGDPADQSPMWFDLAEVKPAS